MARRSPVLRKAVGKVASVAANFIPGGSIVKGAIGLAGSALAGRGGRAGTSRKRRFSIARLQKRLISAKINAKITKTRLSAFKGL